MYVALLVTVPQTGTRLLATFLNGLPRLTHCISLEALSRNHRVFEDLKEAAEGTSDGLNGVGLIPHEGNLVVGHFHEHVIPCVQSLVQYWTPITTIRDPLLTLVSYHHRTSKEVREKTAAIIGRE